MSKGRKSFTLVEMLVAVIIISFLATITYTGYTKVILRAKEREAIINLKSLYVANSAYRSRTLRYWGWELGYDFYDLNALNAALGLNIVPTEGMVYSYRSSNPDGQEYYAYANYNNGQFIVGIYGQSLHEAALLHEPPGNIFSVIKEELASQVREVCSFFVSNANAYYKIVEGTPNPCCFSVAPQTCPTLPACVPN